MNKHISNKLVFIFLFFCMLLIGNLTWANVLQQTITVTGVVSDNNEPLPGVNVTVKGTSTGVISDVNGKYSINVPDENSVLSFSFVGYETHEIMVGNQRVINIVLNESSQMIDEVIVIAYGTTRKSTYTGSATSVSTDKLQKISGTGFAEALQGMSAGVSVTNNQGNPGAESRIQIRGIGTMARSSSVDVTKPLYIVDGMPFDGSLSSIATSDIESMTVLKDAAAASLYGSRAANGVVVITTKKGKSGKASINFKATWGTSDLAVKNPKKANPREQLTNTWEGIYNDQFYKYSRPEADARLQASNDLVSALLLPVPGGTYVSPFKHINDHYVLPTGEINPALQMVWDESDYDWYGAVFKKKLRQDYSFDVSGTSNDGKTNYFFSGSYLDDQGYALVQYYKRYSFRTNINTQINKWMDMGGSIAYSNSKQNTSGFTRALVFTNSLASPWLRNVDNTAWEVSEKTGTRMFSYGDYARNFFGAHPMSASGDYWDNPDDFDFNNNAGNMLSTRFYVQFNLPFDIKFKSNIGLDDNSTAYYSYGSAVHGQGQLQPYGITVKTSGGWASRSNYRTNSMTWNNLLTLNKIYGDHSVNVLAGHELYTYRNQYSSGFGEGIMQLGQYELTSTTYNWEIDSQRDLYTLLSFLGKIDYGYKDRYYLSASYRLDGSSRFHKDERWGNFFSVGASWRISQEPFMENTHNWLTNLILRGSYGTSGNDKIINSSGGLIYYGYQATYEQYDMYGNPGLRPATLATPNLKWENNAQFNVGFDFSLFNRLSGSIEYYDRRSKDLLYYKELPYSSQAGVAEGVNTNLGDMSNSGIEISLGAQVIRNNDFTWNIDANWTTQKNKIGYLPGGEFTFTSRVSSWKIAEGHSRWEYFMPSAANIDPQTGNQLYYVQDASGNWNTTNVYSNVTTKDWQWQGSSIPKGFAAITNTFLYKGFDLSFMFYCSYGSKMFDYIYLERVTLRNGIGVIQDLVKDRWRKPGDIASQPRWSYDSYQSTREATNRFLFDNHYIRLRNLALGYTLPKPILNRMGVSNIRVYLTGDNLLTFGPAAKRHTEPETEITGNNYNGSELTDNGVQGSRRVFMGGIQVSF